MRVGPGTWVRWVAEHQALVPGRSFEDVQVSGPFRAWRHRHLVVPDGAERCVLEDRVEYALPVGWLGDLVAGQRVARDLARVFAFRHAVTTGDLAAHARYRATGPMRVLVSGASGLVGRALVPYLTTGGHEVLRLVRRAAAAPDEVAWDPIAGTIDAPRLEGLDAVVHLAGEPVAEGRWTTAKKARIRESRVQGTGLLAAALARARRPPGVLVSASAVGVYGDRGDETLTEESAPGEGFLAETAVAWEAALAPARDAGIRTVQLRFGIVLSPESGALGRMLPPFRRHLGGRLGSGRQHVSWIALDDALGAVHHAMATPSLEGPVNATAPHPVRNAELTKALGHALGRFTPFAMPKFAARLAFGEMADALLLSSQRVLPAALTASGYPFRYPRIEGALHHLLGVPSPAPPPP
jgi:uncharacterized protein (TIGR01777 family)